MADLFNIGSFRTYIKGVKPNELNSDPFSKETFLKGEYPIEKYKYLDTLPDLQIPPSVLDVVDPSVDDVCSIREELHTGLNSSELSVDAGDYVDIYDPLAKFALDSKRKLKTRKNDPEFIQNTQCETTDDDFMVLVSVYSAWTGMYTEMTTPDGKEYKQLTPDEMLKELGLVRNFILNDLNKTLGLKGVLAEINGCMFVQELNEFSEPELMAYIMLFHINLEPLDYIQTSIGHSYISMMNNPEATEEELEVARQTNETIYLDTLKATILDFKMWMLERLRLWRWREEVLFDRVGEYLDEFPGISHFLDFEPAIELIESGIRTFYLRAGEVKREILMEQYHYFDLYHMAGVLSRAVKKEIAFDTKMEFEDLADVIIMLLEDGKIDPRHVITPLGVRVVYNIEDGEKIYNFHKNQIFDDHNLPLACTYAGVELSVKTMVEIELDDAVDVEPVPIPVNIENEGKKEQEMEKGKEKNKGQENKGHEKSLSELRLIALREAKSNDRSEERLLALEKIRDLRSTMTKVQLTSIMESKIRSDIEVKRIVAQTEPVNAQMISEKLNMLMSPFPQLGQSPSASPQSSSSSQNIGTPLSLRAPPNSLVLSPPIAPTPFNSATTPLSPPIAPTPFNSATTPLSPLASLNLPTGPIFTPTTGPIFTPTASSTLQTKANETGSDSDDEIPTTMIKEVSRKEPYILAEELISQYLSPQFYTGIEYHRHYFGALRKRKTASGKDIIAGEDGDFLFYGVGDGFSLYLPYTPSELAEVFNATGQFVDPFSFRSNPENPVYWSKFSLQSIRRLIKAVLPQLKNKAKANVKSISMTPILSPGAPPDKPKRTDIERLEQAIFDIFSEINFPTRQPSPPGSPRSLFRESDPRRVQEKLVRELKKSVEDDLINMVNNDRTNTIKSPIKSNNGENETPEGEMKLINTKLKTILNRTNVRTHLSGFFSFLYTLGVRLCDWDEIVEIDYSSIQEILEMNPFWRDVDPETTSGLTSNLFDLLTRDINKYLDAVINSTDYGKLLRSLRLVKFYNGAYRIDWNDELATLGGHISRMIEASNLSYYKYLKTSGSWFMATANYYSVVIFDQSIGDIEFGWVDEPIHPESYVVY